MIEIKKFTPLTQSQIAKIVEDVKEVDPEISIIAKKTARLVGEYSDLIAAYRASEDKREFLQDNLIEIGEFLNRCELIGYEGEIVDEEKKLANSDYVIGAEGVMLISAYLKNKPKNLDSHKVEVVRNTDFVSPSGSMKHADIFLENGQVQRNLCETLTRDLLEAGENEFNKTYLFEAFGTTGGNHFAVLTIHKKSGEKAPVVSLFDASPALIRNGLEAAQNSIANGWCSQLIINATAKKALTDCGLIFDERNFYNNSEPLQQPRLSICTTFAYEMAYEIARMDNDAHRKQLEERYRYRSPYGGRTEMDVRDFSEEYFRSELGLPSTDVFMSHFVDAALRPRVEELSKTLHLKKDETFETGLDRVVRYQLANGYNEIAEQKTLRQRFGHLFEIVTNPKFLELASLAEARTESPARKKLREKTPYFPPYAEGEKPDAEIMPLVKAFDEIAPITARINRVQYDKELGNYKLIIYAGEITGNKIKDFAEKNELESEITPIDLRKNMVGIDPRLMQVNHIAIAIPRERISEIVSKLETRGRFSIAEKDPAKHHFVAQQLTSKLSRDLEISRR